MPKYTTPPTFMQVQGCLKSCGRVLFRGVQEEELHFLLRGVCPTCRGSQARHCRWCGRAFYKPKDVSRKVWRGRKFCDQFCGARGSAPVRSQALKARHQSPHPNTPSGPQP